MAARRNKPAKAKVVESLPNLEDTELGELYYDIANGRLAIRLITGWAYFTDDE